eukprot:14458424-Alexandrium_andersonii.AAC.1
MALTLREAYDVIAALRLRGGAGDGVPSHADELAVRIAASAPDLPGRGGRALATEPSGCDATSPTARWSSARAPSSLSHQQGGSG